MKIKNRYYKGFRKKFAFLPVNIDGVTVWLEYYRIKYIPPSPRGGECWLQETINYAKKK